MITQTTIEKFKTKIWEYHAQHRRFFTWRDDITPYKILVSEIMLQQTQASRVAQKFDDFISAFPDFKALAYAPFPEVLKLWKGLGYNRRALALHKTAQIIARDFNHELPKDAHVLETFPGIGRATARSIIAFAFNIPSVFIETNIRTVFIAAFFPDRIDVHDRELIPLVALTLDKEAAREWYYALMDYGVMLKKTVGNKSRQSVHYNRQSPFAGSDRELRGMILQILLENQKLKREKLIKLLGKDQSRIERMIVNLCSEGLVSEQANLLSIAA